MVDVVGLTKNFQVRSRVGAGAGKQVTVLRDLSLTANGGEIYGLLGPNGAGKTTVLRCVATLLQPDSGYITVNGLDVVRDSKAIRAQTGFLTSDMKLAGNLTPRELLTFYGRLNHLNESEIAIQTGRLATYLVMQQCLDTPIERCSTGEKQKAAISISLIHDPELIIFDEPTNGLDIIAAKTVVDFLHDYRSKGKTVILSTHIMSEAQLLCDRIGIILKGRIVTEGTLAELKEKWKKPDLESVFFSVYQAHGIGWANNV